ncbi:MAG: asparagine synthase (glutamine-hydrolyzing) [Acetobacteraceae bacterium]
MCGLAGIFHSVAGSGRAALEPVSHRLLRHMTDAIAHRGPDGEGFYTEPGLGLGFRRLAIIDLAGGTQPMQNEDGSVVIVCNGEIYNFLTLRHELEKLGHVFATHCDVETVIHAWESWGIGALDRLTGMYALALWDRRRRRLLLVRDRLGEKPLYYATAPDGSFVFASELAGLAPVPGVLDRLDAAAVEDFFAFGYVPDPGSIFAGVRKLPAGHYLLIEDGKPTPEPVRYWSLAGNGETPDLEEAAPRLRERLGRLVGERMIADVPLGAFLSGGIDSSTIVALASRQRDRPLDTFTIGFPGQYDERGPGSMIAERFGTLHHTAASEPTDIIAAAERQAAIFGEPFGDLSAVPTFAVAALARRDVTVALSGDGGDEVFGGYRRYRWHCLGESVRRLLPAPVRKPVLRQLAALYPRLEAAPRWLHAKATLTELSLDSALGYARMISQVRGESRRGLLSASLRAALDGYDPDARIVSLMNQCEGADSLQQAQHVDLVTYLSGDILVKVDRASMANSLEVRAPLLDHELVAWGLALPARLKRRGGEGKLVLKEAMAPLLPQQIIKRKKQGFSVSLAAQLRREKPRLEAHLLGRPMLESGLFNAPSLARLIDEHASGRSDHSQALWLLLVFAGFLAGRDGGVEHLATPPPVPAAALT